MTTDPEISRTNRALALLGILVLLILALASRGHTPRVVVQREVERSARKVDDVLAAGWRARGLAPTSQAADRTVARRISLATLGRPPTLEEVRELDADGLRAWTVRRFADPELEAHLADELVDALVGFDAGPFLIYRRRELRAWLEEQLRRGRPFDAITRELVAVRGLWTDAPAANFVTAHATNEKGVDGDALTARFSRVFLGARLECARCHDHPFAKWKHVDFVGVSAFFAAARVGGFGLRDDKDVSSAAEPTVPYRPDLLPKRGTRRERLATWLTSPQNPRFSRAIANRVWMLAYGAPLVAPVDDLPDEVPPALDVLARDFVDHGFDLRRLLRVACEAGPMRLESRDATEAQRAAWAAFPVTPLSPRAVARGVEQLGSVLSEPPSWRRSKDVEKLASELGEGSIDRDPTAQRRLALMNGGVAGERTRARGRGSAAEQIAKLAGSADRAVDAAFLAALTRMPTAAERAFFGARMRAGNRVEAVEDLLFVLANAAEASWSH